jgi:hypothetical protein
MAHYAFLNENNIVTEVIFGNEETTGDWEAYYGEFRGQRCVRTSYNGNIRKNYAGIGFTYNEDKDAFIAPQPYPSWVLDEATCLWEAPVTYPTDDNKYSWDENSQNWIVEVDQ